MPSEATIRYQCRHILASGRRCQSPSLRGENLCYFHHRSRVAHVQPAPPHPESFQLPPIEDRASIQLALNQVIARIADMTLNNRRAGLLLYALQIAAQTLPKPKKEEPEPEPVEETTRDADHGLLAPVTPYEAPGPKPLDRTGRGRSFEEILMEGMYPQDHDDQPEPATIPQMQARASVQNPTKWSCRTGPLRAGRSLRDAYPCHGRSSSEVLPLVGTNLPADHSPCPIHRAFAMSGSANDQLASSQPKPREQKRERTRISSHGIAPNQEQIRTRTRRKAQPESSAEPAQRTASAHPLTGTAGIPAPTGS